jgi:putative ABC transport system permease protein
MSSVSLKFLNFFHVFLGYELLFIPINCITPVNKIEGIDQIQGRLIKDVRVAMLDSEENVYLRLVSIDTSQKPLLSERV